MAETWILFFHPISQKNNKLTKTKAKWATAWENQQSERRKTKVQNSFAVTAVTAKLISAIVFATWIVQFLYLNPKFPASIHLLWGCTGLFVSDLVGTQIVRFLMRWLKTCLVASKPDQHPELEFFHAGVENSQHMSSLVRKPTMWFPNRSDTKQAVQSQKQARS